MKPFFPDKTLHRYSQTNTGSGVYGETIKKHEYVDDILVDFQNETNNQVAHDYGIELSDLFKIYLDIDTPLVESDMLQDDKDNQYLIIGGIQEYPKFHKYKKAHLQIHRRTKT